MGGKKREADSSVGKKYGKWTVLETIHRSKGQELRCRCDCGTEKIVSAITVRNGSSKSCGCSRHRAPAASTKQMTDPREASPQAVEVMALISQGILPPADQIKYDGSPTWSIESISKMLNVDRGSLIVHLKKAGERFEAKGPSGHDTVYSEAW